MTTAEETKLLAQKHAKAADETFNKGVELIENSTLGKKLPLEFKKVGFYDIIKLILIMNIAASTSLYLISYLGTRSPDRIAGNFYLDTTHLVIFFSGAIGTVFDIIVFYGNLKFLFVIVKLLKLVKNCAVVAMMFGLIFIIQGYAKSLFVFYMCGLILFDGLYIYYMTIYYKRLDSPNYDGYGNRITEEEELQKALHESV